MSKSYVTSQDQSRGEEIIPFGQVGKGTETEPLYQSGNGSENEPLRQKQRE